MGTKESPYLDDAPDELPGNVLAPVSDKPAGPDSIIIVSALYAALKEMRDAMVYQSAAHADKSLHGIADKKAIAALETARAALSLAKGRTP